MKLLIIGQYQIYVSALSALVPSEFKIVGQCTSIDQATEIMAKCDDDIIFLVDLDTPRVTESLASLGDQVKIVVLAPNDDARLFWTYIHYAHGYIVKQCTPPELVSALESVAANHYYVHPAVVKYFFLGQNEDNHTTPYTLSPREHQVLVGMNEGLTNRETGEMLGISTRTVESHRAHIYDKLAPLAGARTRSAILAVAKRENLI